MFNIFNGLFDSTLTQVIAPYDFMICVVSALVVGLILAFSYMINSRYSKSFVATIALLPALVCVVIMMVNGNVGTGVAVAGSFSLVRFRSVPGSAKEISAIFLAMATGLVLGMGYIAYGYLIAILFGLMFAIYNLVDFGAAKRGSLYKTLRITIPEDLDYSGVFDDLLHQYTVKYELTEVKTSNMGSLFRLTYHMTLKQGCNEKEFIDKLRCRNGNLEISITRQDSTVAEL